jgi:flagellar hook-associated protein 3 FlgL
MAVLPISITRTSSPLTQQRMLFQLNAEQIALQRKYDELSTGHRILRLSDDPPATNRAIALQRGIERGNQLLRNTSSTTSFYRSTDDALDRVDSALIQARGVTVQAAQTVISADEREALALTIDQSIDAVMAAGNSIFRDHQMLGGFLNSGSALGFDQAEILFSGNTAVGRSAVGAGTPTDINVTGPDAIGVYSVIMEGDSLDAALNSDSRLVDLRQGQGVAAGVIRLSGGGNWIDLDLNAASTVGDVLDLVSAVELDGRPITASIVNNAIQIDYTDGLAGTIAIDDSVGSSMVRELGLLNPAGMIAPPILGAPVPPRATKQTLISDLADGAGLDLSAGIQIKQGDTTFTIDLSGAQTLSDVLISINRSGADVEAELNESEQRIVIHSLRSGVDYSIGENGGTAATELGIRSATAETRLNDLGKGRGIQLNSAGPDFTIIRPDNVQLDINLEGAETVQDVMDIIRNHPQNQDTLRVLVDLASFGNGLQISAPPGVGPLTVNQSGNSTAGVRLGLIPPGASTVTGGIVGAVDTISGNDYVPRDAGGALDTLLRLKDAVREGDVPELERLQAKLDVDLDRSTRIRGRVGVWSQTLDRLQTVNENDLVQMQSQLSDERDAEIATVISNINQRQVSLEASMRLLGQTSQLTVLNFL